MRRITSLKYYYALKPLIPRSFQIYLRRRLIQRQLKIYKDVWPIYEGAAKPPEGWKGWPDGKKFALVLTHDVDTARGHDRCLELARLEKRLGFVSSFNFVPLRYTVSPDIRTTLAEWGFEVGVHGLYHDGKYYKSREKFQERAIKINQFLKEWNCVGYRAPAMCHKLDWFHELNIEYDASTFDTDPFEPNSEGVGTIFPYLVNCNEAVNAYVELPYTLPQDFTLFVLMQHKTIDIWKMKLEWLVEHGGIVLMNTHPDYMNFSRNKCQKEEYPVQYYEELLTHIKENYAGQYWHALPRDLARFWRNEYPACSMKR